MQWDAILETMQGVSNTSFVVILFMAISGALLISHILRVGVFTTLASIPVLLVGGLFGHALLLVNNVLLVPDKTSNTAMSATFGFILIALVTFLTMRVWALIRDRR